MESCVAIAACPSYDPPDLEAGLDRLLSALGGLDRFVRPGQRVLLKPNCIAPLPREKAAQTDGAILVAMARRVVGLGAHCVVGDSPAWGSLAGNLAALGALDDLRAAGAEIVEFRRARRIDNYPMRLYRHFKVAADALDADCIINLPKLKGHKQLGLTAAVKNMFGCIAGKRKAWWHFAAGDKRNDFGWMLVELFDRLRPALTIVDGVIGQQGGGPINGQPRRFGWLAGGVDGVAVERVCVELLGLDPAGLRILQAAETLDIGQPDLARIELLGDRIETLRIDDFARPEMIPIRFALLRVLRSTLKNLLIHRRERSG